MVDVNKRYALKALCGSAVIAVASPGTTAASLQGNELSNAAYQTTMEDIIVPVISSATELSIDLSIEPEPTVKFTNHSNQLIIVRHVYPGIVHVGKQAFNINSIFEKCAYAVDVGKSRQIAIKPTLHTATETGLPRHLNRQKTQRVAALTGRDNRGLIANSSQRFYC